MRGVKQQWCVGVEGTSGHDQDREPGCLRVRDRVEISGGTLSLFGLASGIGNLELKT